MKFLLALSVLASSTVFANDMDMGRKIKCWETAQGDDREVAVVLKEHGDYLKAYHPVKQPLALDSDGCLAYPELTEAMGAHLKLCPGEGQQVNGLVPVEYEYGSDDETVYCERTILPWFLAGEGDQL